MKSSVRFVLLQSARKNPLATRTLSTHRAAVLMTDDSMGVRTLTLNRPPMNLLSVEMIDGLTAAVHDSSRDSAVRVIVIEPSGRHFCAGHDLRQMRHGPHTQQAYEQLFSKCAALMQALVTAPAPVVAKVSGIATAAGCQLVASCDLAVASDSARFAVSGVNLGLFCSSPSVALSRSMSTKRAFEMLVTGEFIDAQAALAYGLVNRVAPEERLDAEVKRLTDAIVSKPPVAIRTGKEMFYKQRSMVELEEAYSYAAGVMARNMLADDTVEGVDAFLAKRPVNWPSARGSEEPDDGRNG